jgi:hypothetical protein
MGPRPTPDPAGAVPGLTLEPPSTVPCSPSAADLGPGHREWPPVAGPGCRVVAFRNGSVTCDRQHRHRKVESPRGQIIVASEAFGHHACVRVRVTGRFNNPRAV